MNLNILDSMFDDFLKSVDGKRKHWEEVCPGVWQVKECYSTDKNNRARLTIRLDGEPYYG